MATPKSLKGDGERMIPEFHKGNIIYGEHLGRYLSISSIIENKTVLDIASGSGYGTKLMSARASYVYGVDNNVDAIKYSKKNYSATNAEFLPGDATKIPLKDEVVDCVVSMETLEHIKDQEEFLNEIKRVMKPNGVLALSTPNDRVYPKGNHFHVKEHNKTTLYALLSKFFSNVKIHYQIVSIAATVIEEKPLIKAEDAKLRWDLYKTYSAKPNESIYFIALCSDSKLPRLIPNTLLAQEYSHLEQQMTAQQLNSMNIEIQNLKINLELELKNNKRLTSQLQTILNSKRWRTASKIAGLKPKSQKK
jgi:ubiquinone/menaquinone biosynthesis C-methylase UbiE